MAAGSISRAHGFLLSFDSQSIPSFSCGAQRGRSHGGYLHVTHPCSLSCSFYCVLLLSLSLIAHWRACLVSLSIEWAILTWLVSSLQQIISAYPWLWKISLFKWSVGLSSTKIQQDFALILMQHCHTFTHSPNGLIYYQNFYNNTEAFEKVLDSNIPRNPSTLPDVVHLLWNNIVFPD